MKDPVQPGPETVLGKTMNVLLAFSVQQPALGFSQLQKKTGLPKATLHRLLRDLVGARLLDRDDDQYHLSGLVFELGMRAANVRTLLEVATPFVEELCERSHETVHLGVRDGHEVVYILKLGGHHQANAPSRLGGRMPLHATALGKSLLAYSPPNVQADALRPPLRRCTPRTIVNVRVLRQQLEEVARSGVAFEYEESAVGITCVAAPILDIDDRVVAGVSVTGPVGRFHPGRLALAVRAAAAGIAATLASPIIFNNQGQRSHDPARQAGPGGFQAKS